LFTLLCIDSAAIGRFKSSKYGQTALLHASYGLMSPNIETATQSTGRETEKSLGKVDDVMNDDTGLDNLETTNSANDDDSISSMGTMGNSSGTKEANNLLLLGDCFIAYWYH